MIILGNLLHGLGMVLHTVIVLFYWVLIARCIISFVSPDPRNPIVQFIYNSTEPILGPVRERVPPLGMFDMSALVVLILLYFLDAFLVNSLIDYGAVFRGRAEVPLSL